MTSNRINVCLLLIFKHSLLYKISDQWSSQENYSCKCCCWLYHLWDNRERCVATYHQQSERNTQRGRSYLLVVIFDLCLSSYAHCQRPFMYNKNLQQEIIWLPWRRFLSSWRQNAVFCRVQQSFFFFWKIEIKNADDAKKVTATSYPLHCKDILWSFYFVTKTKCCWFSGY